MPPWDEPPAFSPVLWPQNGHSRPRASSTSTPHTPVVSIEPTPT
uniref:Alternative protein TCF3 n=1 Tax=Homo sapiens TaxID=9606 RepID=L0R8G9_HUMAN|nr:alternative protein TCF3 [Homo sapiens]